jgi:hypothetical protein
MKDKKTFEDIVRKDLDVRASDATYDRLQDVILDAYESARTTGSAPPILMRRTIMKNPIAKLGLAAVIVAVMGLGLLEFVTTGSKSGVVWAEVARKVNASPGVIYRTGGTGLWDPNEDWPQGYIMHYKSPLHSRTDWSRGGQIRRAVCFDLTTKTLVWLAYDKNVYTKEPMKEDIVQSVQSDQSRWMHPEDITNRFVSHKHKSLGARTIDGVPCEGIETTDPAVFGVNYLIKTFVGRLWVSTATRYPVRMETEVAAGADGSIRQTGFADQFQWDVTFSPADREISIPPGFRPLD